MRIPRIALYGHDTLGLGHVRRNLALASSLSTIAGGPDLLVVTGAAEADSFELPPRTDLLRIPSISKGRDGRYRSGRLASGLDTVVDIRRAVLTAGLSAYDPDLLVVDKVALGLGDELEPALRLLRAAGTRLVLGLRDVLDDPDTVRREWEKSAVEETVLDMFDEVWAYGDPTVHDLVRVHGWEESLGSMVRFTGYLAHGRCRRRTRPPVIPAGVPYVLCCVGGGADGARLATAFARSKFPNGVSGVLLTGSQMPVEERSRVESLARGRDDLHVIPFAPDPAAWIPGARAVVSMGGYNTVTEVLASTTPALVVPRCRPRREQAIRARALADHGAVDMLDETALGSDPIAPEPIEAWLQQVVRGPRVDRSALDLDGLHRVRGLAADLLSEDRKEIHSVLAV